MKQVIFLPHEILGSMVGAGRLDLVAGTSDAWLSNTQIQCLVPIVEIKNECFVKTMFDPGFKPNQICDTEPYMYHSPGALHVLERPGAYDLVQEPSCSGRNLAWNLKVKNHTVPERSWTTSCDPSRSQAESTNLDYVIPVRFYGDGCEATRDLPELPRKFELVDDLFLILTLLFVLKDHVLPKENRSSKCSPWSFLPQRRAPRLTHGFCSLAFQHHAMASTQNETGSSNRF